jgi:hypothetical protein
MEYQKAEMLPFSYDTIISYTILLHMHNQGCWGIFGTPMLGPGVF